MKVAAFQFKGSGNIAENLLAIKRGIAKASEQNVRVLITQECALCGYPPIETENANQIDFHQAAKAQEQILQLVIRHQMVIGLGTIISEPGSCTNSMVLISPGHEKQPSYHKRAL